MKFSMSIMTQLFLLVAVFVTSSVNGRHRVNLRKGAKQEASMDDGIKSVRTISDVLCGRRPALRGKRDVGTGGHNNDENSEHLDKILRGSYVTRGEVPWHVIIVVPGVHICAGAIISEFWVLTAARCVNHTYIDAGLIKLMVGSQRTYRDEDGKQLLDVADVLIHEDYVIGSSDYNIALVKVPRDFENRGIRFNNYVQPICLPMEYENPADGDRLLFSGIGRDTTSVRRQASLMEKVELPVVNREECSEHYLSRAFTERMLCLGEAEGSTDLCTGDIGGPAAYQSGNVYVLSGIFVQGTMCWIPNYPYLFTNVYEYRQWIHETIEENSYNRLERFVNRRREGSDF